MVDDVTGSMKKNFDAGAWSAEDAAARAGMKCKGIKSVGRGVTPEPVLRAHLADDRRMNRAQAGGDGPGPAVRVTSQ